MARRNNQKEGRALIKERERLLKKSPNLQDSFSQFLKSFKKYNASIESLSGHQRTASQKAKFLKQ